MGIPLVALGAQAPPNPFETSAKLSDLFSQTRNRDQATQNAQQDFQLRQQDQQDQQRLLQALHDSGGDTAKFAALAPHYKVSPQRTQAYLNGVADYQSKLFNMDENKRKRAAEDADILQGAHDLIAQAPPEQRAQVYGKVIPQLKQRGIDVSQLPPEYPGDQAFSAFGPIVRAHTAITNEAVAAAELKAKQDQAAAAQQNAATESQKENFNESHFGQVTDKDRYVQGQENARANQAAASSQGTRGDARSDRSYQYNNNELTKIGDPVDAAVSRLGRLQDTLNQNSPQADALVAPELLTVMAGGQGSGLRMNEAEISRVVGGRSKWESLKASINKWSLDPSTANSITPEQRKQIHALVDEVNRRLQSKQQIINDARNSLNNTDDVNEHRRIVSDTRTKLSGVDQGAQGAPAGYVRIRASDGSLHDLPKQNLGAAQQRDPGLTVIQ
jgi:hypothetical protein